MNVNSRFVRPKLLDDLQAEQDIVRNFLEINKAESQEKQVGMDSDGEEEIVEDEVQKAEKAKISEIVLKVSLSILLTLFRKLKCYVIRLLGRQSVARNGCRRTSPSPSPSLSSTTMRMTFSSPNLQIFLCHRLKIPWSLHRRFWVGGIRFVHWTRFLRCWKASMGIRIRRRGSGSWSMFR